MLFDWLYRDEVKLMTLSVLSLSVFVEQSELQQQSFTNNTNVAH